jgi:inorganic triphosphatase YgiF
MTDATELEHKFEVGSDFRLPDLCQVDGIDRVGEPTTTDLDAVYFDTLDGRLQQHHILLRRRSGGTDEGWHLKVGGLAEPRTERRYPLDDSAEPPADLLQAIPIVTDPEQLQPVARIRTRRTERPGYDRHGRTLVSVAEDDVTAERQMDGTRSHWHEIEAELVDGDERLLGDIDTVLLDRGARRGSVPKLVRALRAR